MGAARHPDPFASAVVALMRTIVKTARVVHRHFKTEAAQRKPLLLEINAHVDETILGLQQRMVKLISEASAVASHACSIDSTVDDAVVQRLSGAMASVEWILHCGSLLLDKNETKLNSVGLAKSSRFIASPRQSDGEDKF